jgi:glycosyltransferase involved in cell wall biosynthesis
MLEGRMRILQVVHGYPPEQTAGAEVYTQNLAREMARRGHSVHVLAPGARAAGAERGLSETRADGVQVLRLETSALPPEHLEATYGDPVVDGMFADLLRRLRPDVVHVQHTIGLSIGVLATARSLGVPVVATLHDFWFHCPRGQRMTPRHHLCTKVQPWRCALCIAGKRGSYMRDWLKSQFRPAHADAEDEGALRRGLMLLPRSLRYAGREALRAPILRRLAHIRSALLEADRLLAPSQFLLERYVEQGIPRERLEFSEYGMDAEPFRALGARPVRSPRLRPVRFGFVGTLIPNKGPDLVLRAFHHLPAGQATLDVYGAGNGPTAESYVNWLRGISDHPGLTFRGRFDNPGIAEVLASLDVLVVPSRWWENAPLTLHEAVMAGMPVVTSDHGGMLEMAQRFGNAVLFRAGDSDDLARALRRFLDEPDLWASLRPIRSVRTVAEDVDAQLERYAALASKRVG